MSITLSLDQLSQLVAEARISISPSQEKEILIAAKRFTTPPEVKEELTFEESCISDEEHLFELDIEREEEGISGDQHPEEYPANGSCIEQWIQVSTSLNQFCFCHFNLYFQHLVSHVFIHSGFYFVKLDLNFCLLFLNRWLHWKFHFM